MMHSDWTTEQVLTLSVRLQDLSGQITLAAHQIATLEAHSASQDQVIDRLAYDAHEVRLQLRALERHLSPRKSAPWWRDQHTLGPAIWAAALLATWLLQASGHGPLAERLAEAASKSLTP